MLSKKVKTAVWSKALAWCVVGLLGVALWRCRFADGSREVETAPAKAADEGREQVTGGPRGAHTRGGPNTKAHPLMPRTSIDFEDAKRFRAAPRGLRK